MKSSITGARTSLSANRWYSKDKRSENFETGNVVGTLFLAPTEKNIRKIKINLVLQRENPGYAPIYIVAKDLTGGESNVNGRNTENN